MKDDDVVQRVRERERLAAEAAARAEFERHEPMREQIRARRRAIFALLADIRLNIRALVAANEQYLKPVTVISRHLPEPVQAAGWELGSPPFHFDPDRIPGAASDGHYYLLHDGRLARQKSSGKFRFADDNLFRSGAAPGILERIAALYERAGLRMPEIPAPPSDGETGFYFDVDMEPLPEPPKGVRFYTGADVDPAPPKKGFWRSYLDEWKSNFGAT
jgi:hypothetical protein